MPDARLKFNDQEIEIGDRIITCGRAPDNTIAFPDDSNVSRYHAEIEPRGDEFWIIDLNSSNGTTVNGEVLHGERPLNDGDVILLGGSSELEFVIGYDAKAAATDNGSTNAGGGALSSVNAPQVDVPSVETPDVPSGGVETEAAAVSAGSTNLLLIAGVICGVALLCVAGGAAAFYFGRGSKCDATATITKPEPGDTIANPIDVEVDAEKTGCVSRAVFTLDGLEIASSESEPYTVTIDPSQYPDLADGFDHSLEIVLLDADNKPIGQPNPIELAFETRAVDKPTPTPEVAGTNNQQTNTGTKTSSSSAVTLLDTQQMSVGLIKQFKGNLNYNIANRQFLQEVQKRTAEYAVAGFFDRAAVYRDAINVAYVREDNLDAPLGFILAMSRSKFAPTKQGDNEGLWQMSSAFATANAYNGQCGTETLSDQSQNCAAKASALYMKAMVFSVFDGDPIYSAAAFGKSSQEAAAWKATLPADRSDLWNVIKTPAEREQLVRFFAAGIVAENPQKFGLKDHPLDELYRVTMQ
jgi:pSer/pThr/pTyr-binding forkhead associated (FHA) protein